MKSSGSKIIFLDIDGTLITSKEGPFREDLQAMEEAAGKGHLLFLNTGRSFANIPQSLLEISYIRGIAAGGGTHILKANAPPRYETIYHKWIPEDVLEKAIAWYVKKNRFLNLEGERECYLIGYSPRLHTARPSIPINSFEDFKKKSSCDLITKLTLDGFASEEESRLLEPFFTLNCFAHYSEAIIKGETKGKAVQIILDTLGMEREKTIAIGDSANDLDMLRFAGLGIAMGNAPAEIKAAAGAITADCGKGGVARALEKFVLV